jgi:E1A/CREB-binding protein
MQRLRDIFEPMKKSFLIAHLVPSTGEGVAAGKGSESSAHVDPDDVIANEICDTRQSFLNVCQANHFQFDQLRRAKHSTTMLCYSLHNPTAPINSTEGDTVAAAKSASREVESAERRRARQKSVDLHMRLLVHSSSCKNPHCPSQNCRKMKVIFAVIVART